MKNFLVIEDNGDDALLINRAFAMTESCHAVVCRSLGEAKAYLQGAGVYTDREKYPVPNAVISDLRLGFDSAIDFLRWIRASEELRLMPVIVISGTASTHEGALAKELGALEVLRKPARYEELKWMVQDMVTKLCG
ncbi:MAG TPA: response regulator [Verrucomicrobiae bacterium]|nr:response regulator [Verrucomicrobiae bacterium]